MDATQSPEVVRNRRILLLMAGGVVLFVAIGLALNNGNDRDPTRSGPSAAFASTTQPPPSSSIPSSQPDSEVPPIDCLDILTFGEVNDALGVGQNPALGRGASAFSLNEECTHTIDSDARYFVQISPSGLSDFAPGTQLLGVSAVPVDGVGQRAVWFGGSSAGSEGDSGVIAVEETTEHGRLFLRIFLGRPDVDEATQRQIAADLAVLALTRFPGVAVDVVSPPEPEVVVFGDEVVPDVAGRSLGDNLLAKEQAGEWTRGEGLAASLRYLADELDASEVLSTDVLRDPSATLVVLLARDQLENAPADDDSIEIERLLDLLTRNRARELSTSDLGAASVPRAGAQRRAQDAPETPVTTCADIPENEVCAEPVELPARAGVPPDRYFLFVDSRSGSDWSSGFITAAAEAVLDSAAAFEPLGAIPATTVVLQQGGENLYVDSGSSDCVVHISDALTGVFRADQQFQQLIAREMAFCLIAAEFRPVIAADPAGTRWWWRGLATYLSGVVYGGANAEHRSLPAQLSAEELATTVEDRSWTNWALFEHLDSSIGVEGNLANISGFPVGGDHVEALAAYPDMDELFHEFELALTDASLADLGGGSVPYDPRAWDLAIVVAVMAEFAVPRFGVRRISITVPDGKRACYEFTASGDPSVSWRSGTPGESGEWETEGPESLQGESMLVITTVEPLARFSLTVTTVTDDASCTEELPPTTTLGTCDIGCGPSRYYFPV